MIPGVEQGAASPLPLQKDAVPGSTAEAKEECRCGPIAASDASEAAFPSSAARDEALFEERQRAVSKLLQFVASRAMAWKCSGIL